jgi:hypothetical protein
MEIQQMIVESLIPDEVYTDRQEHIDYYYKAALKAINRQTMSSVLLGQRRMGKTEIFKRVVNRLFYGQENQKDVVIPVFYQFPENSFSHKAFALQYIENFLRWFAAFHLNSPDLLRNPVEMNDFLNCFENQISMTQGTRFAIDLFKAVKSDGVVVPEYKAIHMPKAVAFSDNIRIAMFLDEFQNTRKPHQNFNIVGCFQEAVESPRCPHFVTGSAISILHDEILGKGALYGRFRADRIASFTDYYATELVHRAALFYHADISLEMAPVIADKCGGNPFYITAIVQQAAIQEMRIDQEETLNEIMAIDISSGFIWAELSDQVNGWIKRINELGITKWVLYLAAIEEKDEIDLYRIQHALKEYEYVEIPVTKIKEILIKLARGDLIEYKMFGNRFGKLKDPILNEFLRIWGEIEVVKYNRSDIEDQTIKKFKKIEKKFHEYRGYLAEIYLIQILWNSQRKKLPGQFFHHPNDIQMPNRFIYINQRNRKHAGKNVEIDVYASTGTRIWMAESKWQKKPVGIKAVQRLLKQRQIVYEQEADTLDELQLWLFSYSGVTKSASNLMAKESVLWSSKDDLNALLELVGLRKLPELQ